MWPLKLALFTILNFVSKPADKRLRHVSCITHRQTCILYCILCWNLLIIYLSPLSGIPHWQTCIWWHNLCQISRTTYIRKSFSFHTDSRVLYNLLCSCSIHSPYKAFHTDRHEFYIILWWQHTWPQTDRQNLVVHCRFCKKVTIYFEKYTFS